MIYNIIILLDKEPNVKNWNHSTYTGYVYEPLRKKLM